jgi:hypothetical protein
LGRIRENYIATGKVRFVYKHFAILGQESNRAAEASECAAEQEQFWAYHDLIFVDQATSRSTLNDDKLISLAGEIGLDRDLFGECLKSNRYTNQIIQESQVVQTLGVRGTPGFVVNGTYLAGAQPYETFAQVFDEQLAQLGVEVPAGQASTSTGPEIEGVVTFPTQPQTHQEGDIEYAQTIPPGGIHNAAWQNCGIYDTPVRVENVLHSLEHGAVWLAYQPNLTNDEVDLLRILVRQAPRPDGQPMVILSPHPDLDAPIVATAWQAQLSVDTASDQRLVDFLVAYQSGPFTPEPGAPCSDGVGEPLD